MRIAWCTPFGPQSAIGRVSELVVEQLVRRPDVEVDVWQPRQSVGRRWSGTTRTVDPDDFSPLEGYDHVVYHLGNHAGNHFDLWLAAQHVPGVVVLHDTVLSSLFHDDLVGDGRYADELGAWYGRDAAALAGRVLRGSGETPPWLREGGMAYPFLSLAASQAQAVVVHSEYAARAARDVVLADVEVIGLPVEAASFPATTRADLGLPDDVPILLQAGIFHHNKRIDAVVEAFAELRRTRPAYLVLAGRPGGLSVADVEALLVAHEVTDAVVFDDPSDEVLAALRAHADVALALREPCLEGASYSLLESLVSGLPVVTVDDGSYAEVSGSFIRHVPVPTRASDVAHALEELLAGPADTMRAEALAYVRAGHTAEAYGNSMVSVLSADHGAAPRERLVTQLSAVVARLGLVDVDEVVGRLAARVEDLFADAAPRVFGEPNPDRAPLAASVHHDREVLS